MKLYVYFLKIKYNKPPEFRVEEFEVEEKPKTYVIIGKLPPNTYTSRIRKEDIGRLITTYGSKVFLKSPDLSKAKELFLKMYDRQISDLREEIKNLKFEKNIIYDCNEKDTKC